MKNFSIDSTRGILSPRSAIDFEKLPAPGNPWVKLSSNVRSINLMVEARDLGVPSLSNQVPVTIYVEDVNDHSPRFEQSFYQTSVAEDLPPGSSVLQVFCELAVSLSALCRGLKLCSHMNIQQVRAYDEDGSAPNNAVVYRIQSGAEDKFVVDAITGVIRVAQGASLDPDLAQIKINFYSLNVIALDGGIGENQRKSSVIANITIQDVNNKPPVFIEPGTIHLKENTPVPIHLPIFHY